MLAVVPLWGLLATGSWRAARRYAKDWALGIAVLLPAGLVAVAVAL